MGDVRRASGRYARAAPPSRSRACSRRRRSRGSGARPRRRSAPTPRPAPGRPSGPRSRPSLAESAPSRLDVVELEAARLPHQDLLAVARTARSPGRRSASVLASRSSSEKTCSSVSTSARAAVVERRRRVTIEQVALRRPTGRRSCRPRPGRARPARRGRRSRCRSAPWALPARPRRPRRPCPSSRPSCRLACRSCRPSASSFSSSSSIVTSSLSGGNGCSTSSRSARAKMPVSRSPAKFHSMRRDLRRELAVGQVVEVVALRVPGRAELVEEVAGDPAQLAVGDAPDVDRAEAVVVAQRNARWPPCGDQA